MGRRYGNLGHAKRKATRTDDMAPKLVIKDRNPNFIVIALDDAPTFFFRGWDEVHPFVPDGVNPFNASQDPSGQSIYAQTPNIDALCADGLLFLNSYANPVCSNDRACLFTGLYAKNHGIGRLVYDDLEFNTETGYDNLTTLPQHLQQQGYTVGIAGKWHLSVYDTSGWPHIPAQGWDDYRCTFSNLSAERQPTGGPTQNIAGGWSDEGGNVWSQGGLAGTMDAVFFSSVEGTEESSQGALNAANEWYFDNPGNTLYVYNVGDPGSTIDFKYRMNGGNYNFYVNRNGVETIVQSNHLNGTGTSATNESGFYAGDVVFTDAANFIAGATEPWCSIITPNPIHNPYEYPMPDSKVSSPAYKAGPNTAPTGTQYQWTNSAAAIEFMDTRIGELLAGIPQNQLDHTVVIFTSDNGSPSAIMQDMQTNPDSLGNPVDPGSTIAALNMGSGARWKTGPYEGSTRVPTVIAGPIVAPALKGQKTHARFHTADILPTLCDYAELPIPSGLDGVSQKAVLDGSSITIRTTLLTEIYAVKDGSTSHPTSPNLNRAWIEDEPATGISVDAADQNFYRDGFHMVFTDKGPFNGWYKYVKTYDDAPTEELYWLHDSADQPVDLYELNDLWNDPSNNWAGIQAEIVAQYNVEVP